MNINKITLVALLFLGINILVTADELNLSERKAIGIINDHFEEKQLSISRHFLDTIPATITSENIFFIQDNKNVCDSLVLFGLMSFSYSEEREIDSLVGKENVIDYVYDLTPKGKKYFLENNIERNGKNYLGFLVGRKKVKRIKSFGEVRSFLGAYISQIEVEIEILWEPWAEEFQGEIKALEDIHDVENITLVFRDNKWIHGDNF